MRYFTRQLYVQFNSQNDEEADRADEAWETAIREYGKHLDDIRERMPSNVSKLAELNLHDADILSREEAIQPGAPVLYPVPPFPILVASWSAVAIVSVRLGGDILSLIYSLSDHVRVHPAPDDWQFSKLREHWLYDEVDILSEGRGLLVHRILLSSGIELEIPFTSVVIHRFAMSPEAEGVAKKQSA